ncbi:MAG: hypothetical protein FJ030_13360 [Chloroflexi bacterium]|nr:hypothetical protein [Chloroflexota bacterium]
MKRPLIVSLAALIAFLIGLVSLLSALIGFAGRGNSADAAAAVPSLIVGLASLIGAVGYWLLKKRGHYVYAVAVIVQTLNHVSLFISYLSSGRANIVGMIFLIALPCALVIIFVGMEFQRRKGVLL